MADNTTTTTAAARTIGELRRNLAQHPNAWQIDPKLPDTAQVPTRALGGDPKGLPLATAVPRFDFKTIVKVSPITNPMVLQRRVDLGIHGPIPIIGTPGPIKSVGRIPGAIATAVAGAAATAPATTAPPATAGGALTSVDWRNRWGWPWITSVRDQDPCESCWAFAATALVESSVRIGHAVWTHRSEGDVHDGMGAKCANTGGSQAALDWIKTNGIADPDCWPYRTDDPTYAPTPDRNGRTVKIDDYTLLGSTDDQKNWLDSVGPIVTWFEVYDDFQAYGGGTPYSKTQNAIDRGGHFMLVVGYDDNAGVWIVKNSWGSGWGDHGFAAIYYGQCDIDKYSKIGLASTNPDPWTKRRMHSGSMIESGDGGAHRNFEMLATTNGAQIRHWWRDNTNPSFPWAQASVFGNDAAVCPTLTATTFNRNFECVYLTTGNRLHHWWLDQNTGSWNDGGVFGPNDAYGVPGFIQGNYNAPGNFEAVVRTQDGRLNHWWRDGSGWHDGGRFASGVAFSGASLIQSNYGSQGNFELVCVLDGGQMQHWWRDNDNGMVWNAGPSFGSGVSSPPCMIEGQYGMGDENAIGNFELCVAVGGQVQHWWRDNQNDMSWTMSATFGHDVQCVAALIEGSFGFNLEVIVLRTDQQLQHYWRDGDGWHEGPVIGSAA